MGQRRPVPNDPESAFHHAKTTETILQATVRPKQTTKLQVHVTDSAGEQQTETIETVVDEAAPSELTAEGPLAQALKDLWEQARKAKVKSIGKLIIRFYEASARKSKGLLTPDQIRDLREGYKLSQKSFAALLGMSEATINRYEGGALQDEAHDQAIRACANPQVVSDLLRRRGHKLSDWQRRRVESALQHEQDDAPEIPVSGQMHRMPDEASLRTGYRRFSFDRYAAVVVWFCRRLRTVTPTSLNKLLFYADFQHFRTHAVSLTGAAYRRLPYGPVPADYGGLRGQMELDQIVEVREVQWQNGNVGEEYHVGSRAGELETSFSASELDVLETVAKTFQDATPSQLSDRSHTEAAWKDTENRALISYEKAAELSLPVPT